MDKYSGLNKVETNVVQNDQIVRKEKKARGGYFKILCVQTAVAVLLGGALFAGRLFSFRPYEKVTDTVKDAVCFDAVSFITDAVQGDEQKES